MATIVTINRKLVKKIILKSCKESNAIKPYGKNAYVVFFQNFDWKPAAVIQRGRLKNRKLLSKIRLLSVCKLLSPLSVRRPSVNFSHFNQLLWSHWANLNQTLVEWSLDGPLPKKCPVIPTSNQDGRQAKNRKKGDEILIVHCCFSISQIELKF
jgi:hypothetical protein